MVRFTLNDDLQRRRLTVFFRALLVIPCLIWVGLWGFGAAIVVVINWVATLIRGQSPATLHEFLAKYVRYTTHVYAYLYLAADPFPGFSDERAYPVDVEIDPPARQNRWTVGFRLVLAFPALLLVGALVGSGSFLDLLNESSESPSFLGALVVVGILGWFYAMARGRMPRGLRDLGAYALSYGAHAWAYLLLLTARYPSNDPLTAIGPLPTRSDPVRMEVTDELRRSRLTVFFRLALAIPHLVWLTLWGLLALLVAIVNWFATLALGTSPSWAHRFLSRYVRYQLHVSAFLYLVGNPFPGFVGAPGTYPIELHVAERSRQNRWTVVFRAILALPALILSAVFGQLLAVIALLGWFAGLFTARMPLGLRNAGAYALRYNAQANAYFLLVTGAYPYSGPCHEGAPETPVPAAGPPPVAVPLDA
jgi:Domain of unknown function (DUF4389)